MQTRNITNNQRRFALCCVMILALLILAACDDNDDAVLSTPNVNVLAPTATALVARIEVMVVVVTPTPDETSGSNAAPAPQEETSQEETSQEEAPQEEAPRAQDEASAGNEQQLIAMGEQVYAENCATCHGESGEGDSLYPALNNSGLLAAEDPGSAIQIVLHGRGEMPAFADSLSSEEIAAVLSYERSAWNNSAPAVTVDEVESVQQGDEATENGGEAQTDNSEADTSDTKTADTESADTESADTESADTESADTESADTESADTESADTESADTTEETEASDTNDTETPDATTTSDADTAASAPAETPTPASQDAASSGPQPTWTPARRVTPLTPAAEETDTGTPSAEATATPSPAEDSAAALPPLRWTPSRMVTPLLPSSIDADSDQEEAAGSESESSATPEPEQESNDTESTSSAGDSADGSAQDILDLGEQIYREECATCHASSGEGTGVYPALEGSETLTAEDPTEAINIVLNGIEQMPSFGNILSDEEIAAVLTYERNSWGNNAAEITVGQVQSVRETGRAE